MYMIEVWFILEGVLARSAENHWWQFLLRGIHTQCYSRARSRSIASEKQTSHQYLKTNTNTEQNQNQYHQYRTKTKTNTTNTGPIPKPQSQNYQYQYCLDINTAPIPILQHQNFDTKFGIGACLVLTSSRAMNFFLLRRFQQRPSLPHLRLLRLSSKLLVLLSHLNCDRELPSRPIRLGRSAPSCGILSSCLLS